MKNSVIAGACVAVLGTAVLTGCSSDRQAASDSEGTMVGGMTECTLEELQSSVDEAVKALGADDVLSDPTVSCAEGWAVVGGTLGPADASGTPTTFIFQQEGQFWIPKDTATVCGTMDPQDPQAWPADAEIPLALYPEGCVGGTPLT